MSVNVNDYAKIGDLGQLAQLTGQKLAPTFKAATAIGNTVSFYTTTDTTQEAAFHFDFPEEIFLDQTVTELVDDFAFSSDTYVGATNPNLDGKTVLVLGVKGDAQTPTIKYSFVSLEKLIDVYTEGDASIEINGYTIKVKISQAAKNALKLNNDGLFVDAIPAIDNPTTGNVPTIQSDGTLANSTIVGGNIMFKVTNPTAGNIPEIQSDGTIANSAVPLADVLQKVSGATAGHVVVLQSDGTIADSGYGVAADSDVAAYLATQFAAGESTTQGGGN